jgi:hypothetical protein
LDGRPTHPPCRGDASRALRLLTEGARLLGRTDFRRTDSARHECNNALAAAILDEKIPDELSPESIDTAKAKAKLVDLLKKSSVFLHRVFSFVNEDNARVWIKHPIFGIDTTRLTLCSVIVAHSFDHYGQMVVYLRMNGIVPPASRQ